MIVGLLLKKGIHVDFHHFICLGTPNANSKFLKINSSFRRCGKFTEPKEAKID